MNAITNSLARRLVEDPLAREQIRKMGRSLKSMHQIPYEIIDSSGNRYYFVTAPLYNSRN